MSIKRVLKLTRYLSDPIPHNHVERMDTNGCGCHLKYVKIPSHLANTLGYYNIIYTQTFPPPDKNNNNNKGLDTQDYLDKVV